MTAEPVATAAAWTADQATKLVTTVGNLQEQISVSMSVMVFALGIIVAYCLITMITRGLREE